jgi:hypothetical protein
MIERIAELTKPLHDVFTRMVDHDNFFVVMMGFILMTAVLMAVIVIPILVLIAIFGDGGPCPEGTRELTEFSHFIWTGKVQVPVYETVGCVAS